MAIGLAYGNFRELVDNKLGGHSGRRMEIGHDEDANNTDTGKTRGVS